MEKLKEIVYSEDHPVAKLETKFSVTKISTSGNTTTLMGNHPLESFHDNARGTYGGELIAQALNAAWETVPHENFHPHSLHCYFVKPGSNKSPIRWDIVHVNDSRNFANRMVMGYQNDKLIFTLQCSFAKDNDQAKRELEYAESKAMGEPVKSIPFTFKKAPNAKFFQMKEKLNDMEDLVYFEHTNTNMAHAVPKEYFQHSKHIDLNSVGNKEFGLFVKVLDNYHLGKDFAHQSHLGLAFASDSLWLATIIKAIGLPLSADESDFFRVSLDHSLYFHDFKFDSSDWIFLDYRFLNMGNNRILTVVNFFNIDGKPIATAVQEAYGFLPQRMIDASKELHDKFERAEGITRLDAKL
ncbi:Peroxisomal acyl-coenzyme A thioester hydrolase 1 [Spathaspora sp. JA1]|nr:Peroxisomal acyl-coenzyme A thioester hydrolase 1 [Spathaspora sp. JA1]